MEFLPPEHPKQREQGSLRQKHFSQTDLTSTFERVCETHVEFDKKHSGDIEVLIGPELLIVHKADASFVVAYVYRKPDFLQDEGGAGGKEKPFVAQAFDNSIDNALSVENHTQPRETRHISNFPGNFFVRPGARIFNADCLVAAKDKYSRRLRSAPSGFGKNHGRETGVRKPVEVFRYSVEGDEIFDIKVFGHLDNEFWIIKESIENVEFTGINSRRELGIEDRTCPQGRRRKYRDLQGEFISSPFVQRTIFGVESYRRFGDRFKA